MSKFIVGFAARKHNTIIIDQLDDLGNFEKEYMRIRFEGGETARHLAYETAKYIAWKKELENK